MSADRPKPSPSPADRLAERASQRLVSALERAGWRRAGSARGAEVELRKGQRALRLHLAAASGRARRPVLRGRLADAVLRGAAEARESGGDALAVVAAPAISDPMAAELRDYMAHVAPDAAWGLVDDQGRFELHGAGLEEVQPAQDPPAAPWSSLLRPSRAPNPFSDLGQWMLKVLLARNVPVEWLSAPREPLRSGVELARQAGVSQASASRFLAALEASGHVDASSGAPRLVRIDALLDGWRRAVRRAPEQVYARFLLPSPDAYDRLRGLLAQRARAAGAGAQSPDAAGPDAAGPGVAGPVGGRACLGLFAACRALGLGFVDGAPVHLLSEDLSPGALEKLGLMAVEHPAEAELEVARPRFPESVFRGCVLADGAPAADALQCWLDVSDHPARGTEQSEEIAARLGLDRWEP